MLRKTLHYIFFFSDGAGRSGTYIAISNLVDRVKVVQVIDAFQCIKMIRIRRPQFVETAVSYVHSTTERNQVHPNYMPKHETYIFYTFIACMPLSTQWF